MSLDFAAIFALQREDVGRCNVCWLLFHKDDASRHLAWHRQQAEIHRRLSELAGVETPTPEPSLPDPEEPS
jgi:hypothetical protein